MTLDTFFAAVGLAAAAVAVVFAYLARRNAAKAARAAERWASDVRQAKRELPGADDEVRSSSPALEEARRHIETAKGRLDRMEENT